MHTSGFDDSVMSVVGLEQQFDDIERFCACEDQTRGSVLGIDPTFNLGDFYVTPTTYEHMLLKNRKTGKHPVFIGPLMIHQNRKHDTYYYFASQLRKMRPGLQSLFLQSAQMVRKPCLLLSRPYFQEVVISFARFTSVTTSQPS